ncbi:P1 family peptidase [Shimia ponticola]|uniref:P1 family peptidase n=1 Tax=Shimia ponticola TaxID=2582893 RepID=UPI0011BF0F8E|nr:P1 family peptidase [Shimia ponticola]
MTPGQRNLITDVSGFRVGHAQDAHLRSGTSVLVADQPFTAGVHIMGGAPGTRETQLLTPDRMVQQVDALVLSGGSAFGLAAADGVADGLRKAGRGFNAAGHLVPIVPAAILFDLANGGDKNWSDNPYPTLGVAALADASLDPALGSVGAGAGATTADLVGGFGSASATLESGYTVGAMVAANPLGSVVAGDAGQFWAAPWELEDEFGGLGNSPSPAPQGLRTKLNPQATTIAIVATDAALDQAACTRMATAAHDGMARSIVPSHTLFDGDLVFAASSGARAISDPVLDPIEIGHTAASVLARAIARAIYHATSWPDGPPAWQDLYGRH